MSMTKQRRKWSSDVNREAATNELEGEAAYQRAIEKQRLPKPD